MNLCAVCIWKNRIVRCHCVCDLIVMSLWASPQGNVTHIGPRDSLSVCNNTAVQYMEQVGSIVNSALPLASSVTVPDVLDFRKPTGL